MAADTVVTGANLTMQEWQSSIEGAVYDKMRFLPKTKERERGYATLNVRKMGTVAGQTLATSSDGTNMSFDTMAPTVVTMVPAWYLAAHAYSDALPWTAGDGIDRAAADNVESSLAAYIETNYLAVVASLTNNIGNGAYDTDAAGWRAAVANLFNNAKVLGEPGSATIYGLLGALQHDDAMSIPEFTHADQRGDGQNPLVSGVIGKGNSVNLAFSTLLYTDANGSHGCVWVPSAFGYFYNKRPSGEKQRYLKQTRVMADAHIGFNIVHNSRAVDFRTKSS